jgi:hypothetical protein
MQPEAPETLEIDRPPAEPDEQLVRPRPAIKRRSVMPGVATDTLQPTRSGSSLEHRAAREKRQDPTDRRQERRESSEIAALKARLQHHDTLQSQWKIAQEELSVQKQARAGDAARMAEQLALLETVMDTASSEAVHAFKAVSRQRSLWRVIAALAGTAALIFLCLVAWPSRLFHAGLTDPSTSENAPVQTTNGQRQAPAPQPGLFQALPKDPQAALATALDRLNGALETVPGVSPEEALRKVSARGSNCGIVWSNNLPAVVFGLDPSRPNSLAATLEDCAEAVARFH